MYLKNADFNIGVRAEGGKSEEDVKKSGKARRTKSDSDVLDQSRFDEETNGNAKKKRKKLEMVRLPRPDNRLPLQECETLCLSFGGCGFLGSYEFGAAKTLWDHGKGIFRRIKRFAGCSSGSLVATLLIFCPDKLGEAVEEIYKLADEVTALPFGAMTPGFLINDRLRSAVEKYIPDDISEAKDRLFVSVTNLREWKNEIIMEFKDRDDLINVLMASCYHPMYSKGISGSAPVINGRSYIDGGYSNNLPEFADFRTITVTAFAGDADICPNDKSELFNDKMMAFFNQNLKLTLSNLKRITNSLFPPEKNDLKKYYDRGVADSTRFLEHHLLYNELHA